jgi:hypothetical protein
MVLPGREHTFPTWNTDESSYRKIGSYRFSSEQRASEILCLDVEIDSYSHEKYENKKSNPDYSFYGYATIFHGSTVYKKIPLEFAKQRVVFANNQHITLTSFILSSHYSTLTSLLTISNLGFDLPQALQSFADLFNVPYPGMFDENCSPKPFDLLGHRETVVKVETYGQSQFSFKCSWMMPIIFGDVPLAVISDDATDGEEEYPDPPKNPSDSPYEGNDLPSPQDPDSDPRDFDDPTDPSSSFPPDSGGTLAYEYNTIGFDEWTSNTKTDVSYPGEVRCFNDPDYNGLGVRRMTILYGHVGGDTRLVAGGTGSRSGVEVRNVRYIYSDGTQVIVRNNLSCSADN